MFSNWQSMTGPGAVAVTKVNPVVLTVQAGHVRPEVVGGSEPGRCTGRRPSATVKYSSATVRLAILAATKGHVQRLVASIAAIALDAHAAVDRLGGQGVPQLVGWMTQPSRSAGAVDHPGHTVAVHRFAVLAWQQQRVPGGRARPGMGVDQLHDARVQGR